MIFLQRCLSSEGSLNALGPDAVMHLLLSRETENSSLLYGGSDTLLAAATRAEMWVSGVSVVPMGALPSPVSPIAAAQPCMETIGGS